MEKVIKVQTDALFGLSRDYKNYGENINGIYRTEAGKIERELENILRNYSDYSSVKSKVFELQRMLGENRQKIKDVQGRADHISGGLHHAAQSYIEAEEKEKKLIASQKDKIIQLDDVNKVNKPGISINVDLKRPDEKDPDSISDAISKAVDKGIDFIRNIDVKETISGITKKVGNTVSNIKENISDAVSKCGNRLENFIGSCKSAVSNIANKMKEMWEKFTSECSKIFKKAREFFADFGKQVTEVAKFIADKAIVAVNYVIEHKDAILDGLKTVGIVLLEVVQFILDIAGLIPGIGEIADAINGCIYLLRGDMVSAGLSFAACIPFAGWGATIGKFIKKGAKLFEKIGDVSKLVDKVKDFAKYFDKLKDFGKTITKYGDNVLSFIKKKGSEVWDFLSKSKLVQKAKEAVSKVVNKMGDVGSFLRRQVDKVKVNIGDWLYKQGEKGRIPPKVAEWINKHVIGKEARERLAREAIEREVNQIADNVKKRVLSKPNFHIEYTDDELAKIILRGKELGLSNKSIEDLILVGSRDAKRIGCDELLQQMDNYANVVNKRGYPYLFNSKEEFDQYVNNLKGVLDKYGIKGEVVIQGSSLRKADAADIDIDVRISEEEFQKIVNDKFKNANPGSANERTKLHALESGKIKLSQAGYKNARNEIIELGVDFDISFISKSGEFAIEPYMKILDLN